MRTAAALQPCLWPLRLRCCLETSAALCCLHACHWRGTNPAALHKVACTTGKGAIATDCHIPVQPCHTAARQPKYRHRLCGSPNCSIRCPKASRLTGPPKSRSVATKRVISFRLQHEHDPTLPYFKGVQDAI